MIDDFFDERNWFEEFQDHIASYVGPSSFYPRPHSSPPRPVPRILGFYKVESIQLCLKWSLMGCHEHERL